MKKIFLLLISAFLFSFVHISIFAQKESLNKSFFKKITNKNTAQNEITSLQFFSGFEDFSEWNYWTIYNRSDCVNDSFANLVTNFTGNDYVYEGENSVCFSSYKESTLYDQYIASENINLGENTKKIKLSFYYRKYIYGDAELFRTGYCLEDVFDLSKCIWGDTIKATNNNFKLYETTFPANIKSVVIHYFTEYSYYLFVDNITLFFEDSYHTPTNLTATKNTTTNYIDLKWDPFVNAIKYNIYKNNNESPIATVTTNKYTDETITGTEEVCYYVKSVCSDSLLKTSVVSNEACVNKTSLISYDKPILFYPNPAKDFISISIPDVALMNIYDIYGSKVYSKEVSNNDNISINGLVPGFYIASFKINDQVFNIKFVKE